MVPPLNTIVLYKSFLKSKSHLFIQLYIQSCIPPYSAPIIDGLNNISGALYLAEPIFNSVTHPGCIT